LYTPLVYRLAVLSNVPETLSPLEYQVLLPAVKDEDVVEYCQDSLREADWCELEQYR